MRKGATDGWYSQEQRRKRNREKWEEEEGKIEKDSEGVSVDEEPGEGIQCMINRKYIRMQEKSRKMKTRQLSSQSANEN